MNEWHSQFVILTIENELINEIRYPIIMNNMNKNDNKTYQLQQLHDVDCFVMLCCISDESRWCCDALQTLQSVTYTRRVTATDTELTAVENHYF